MASTSSSDASDSRKSRLRDKVRANVTPPARIAGVASFAYVVWGLVPVWFHCCSTTVPGATQGLVRVNAGGAGALKSFPTTVGLVVAFLAFAGVAAIAAGLTVEGSITAATIELFMTSVVGIATILGFFVPAEGWVVQWGLFVGLTIAAVAVYGSSVWHAEAKSAAPPL